MTYRYLQNVHGYSPVQAGVRLLPLSISMMFGSPLGGVLTEKFGLRPRHPRPGRRRVGPPRTAHREPRRGRRCLTLKRASA
jgi:hypothetical protein